MKKTMLTYKTLDRFEKVINPDTLTAEQVQEVEFLAYCANSVTRPVLRSGVVYGSMGADNLESAWIRFCELVEKYIGIKTAN